MSSSQIQEVRKRKIQKAEEQENMKFKVKINKKGNKLGYNTAKIGFLKSLIQNPLSSLAKENVREKIF